MSAGGAATGAVDPALQQGFVFVDPGPRRTSSILNDCELQAACPNYFVHRSYQNICLSRRAASD